jgi:hypothetical protein
MDTATIEKRRLHRRDMYHNCEVTDASGSCIGTMADINSRGLKLLTPNIYRTGQILDLSILLPQSLMGKTVISFCGTVRWCLAEDGENGNSAGIEITSITNDDSESLIALMAFFSFSV